MKLELGLVGIIYSGGAWVELDLYLSKQNSVVQSEFKKKLACRIEKEKKKKKKPELWNIFAKN